MDVKDPGIWNRTGNKYVNLRVFLVSSRRQPYSNWCCLSDISNEIVTCVT